MDERYARLSVLLRQAGRDEENLSDQIYVAADAREALVYAPIFCPPLIEIEGLVLQDLHRYHWGTIERDASKIRELLSAGDDVRDIQRSFNRMELYYFFDSYQMTADEEQLLVELIAESWRAWLHWRYPARRFIVEVEDQLDEPVELTFYQEPEP